MALVDIDANLGDERVSERELRQRIPRDRNLTDADETDPKLRDGDETAGELADCNNSFRWHRHAVRSVFEGNMHQGQAQYRRVGLAFKSEAIPLVKGREWRPSWDTPSPVQKSDVGILCKVSS